MKIGTYLFMLNGADYLIVVDYISNFPEIVKLRGTTSKHVIDALKSIMARFGIPKIVFSDNAPVVQWFRESVIRRVLQLSG